MNGSWSRCVCDGRIGYGGCYCLSGRGVCYCMRLRYGNCLILELSCGYCDVDRCGQCLRYGLVAEFGFCERIVQGLRDALSYGIVLSHSVILGNEARLGERDSLSQRCSVVFVVVFAFTFGVTAVCIDSDAYLACEC